MGSSTYDENILITGTGGGPPAPASKADNVTSDSRGAQPFTVYVEFDCSPVGNTDAQLIATDALARSENWQVERAFWTGLAGGQAVVYPHLAANATLVDAQNISLQTVPVTGGTVTGNGNDAAESLGILEAKLADCYDGVGIIHVPRLALPTLDAWGLVKYQTGRITTANGNIVAVGGGYPGTSPAGAAPAAGTSWLYATGQVFGWRGDVKVFTLRESIDRSENTVRMIAERTYVLGWECCHAAVLMQLGVPT